MFGSSLWLRFARCVARSVIVVAGKLASILICGLAAELRNSQPQSVLRFCVFGGQGFFWVDFSWSAFRNSQPQSVLRFCVFGGQGFFGLTKKKPKTVCDGPFRGHESQRTGSESRF